VKSEITLMWWFAAQETFMIIISVENSFFFTIIQRIESWKEQHLFDIEIFWNIINVFNVILINLMCPIHFLQDKNLTLFWNTEEKNLFTQRTGECLNGERLKKRWIELNRGSLTGIKHTL